jgi:uncharacterized protein (TIGR00290 family)
VHEVEISKGASNDDYETSMSTALTQYRADGIQSVVFGDLFLEEVRAYRERLLVKHGMRGEYPLWGRNTRGVIDTFIALGFKTIVVCVDPRQLDPSFCGRVIDAEFLADLPAQVDPCGENGEFHTFVFDGPNFKQPILLTRGEVVCRDSFWFCDLIPA